MTYSGVLTVLLLVYLVILTGTGIVVSRLKQRGSSAGFVTDYFLGGRSLPGFVLAMTLVATYTSGSSFLGGPGMAYNQGFGWVLLAMIQLPAMYVALGVLGKRFNIVGRKIGAVTVVDFLRERYEGNAFLTITSAFFIVVFLVAAIAAQFLGGARIIESLTGLNYVWCLVVFSIVVMVYLVLGGFTAVALNDSINGTLMSIGTIALLVATLKAGGGIGTIMSNLKSVNPDLLTPYGVKNFISIPWISSFWVLVCIGTLGLPQMAVRAMAYKDSKAMHRAIVIGTVVIGLLMLGMHTIGAFARAIVPDVKVTDMVIPTLAMKVLHPIGAALVLTAPLAAIISTVDSQLVYVAGTIVKDIYLNYMNPNADEKRIEKLSRAMNAAIVLLVLALSIKPPSTIVWINLFAFGGLEAAFFWPLLMGLYSKRANAAGMIAAQLSGVASFIWFTSKLPRPMGLHPIVPTMVISGVVGLLVSYLTPPPKLETIKKFWGV
ncbi:MAG TPA: sodium/panthothenate symporter [Firmicutes bacterium]|nr:sodium/panthothenate symporter [Candidatus Fermentithermobacillaceae bacterium]